MSCTCRSAVADNPTPTYLKLLSADVDPQLLGAAACRARPTSFRIMPNDMWIDPQQPGIYLGQCAQFCGVEHAKMLLRVYVETPEQFARLGEKSATDRRVG